MADPKCRRCGKTQAEHGPAFDGTPLYCSALSTACFAAEIEPIPEAKGGEELPRLVYFGQGVQQIQVLWSDFLAALPTLSPTQQELCRQKLATGGVVKMIRELESERDSLRDQLGSAQNNCADYADLVKSLREQLTAAESAREEAAGRTERAEDAERLHREGAESWRMLCLRMGPVVEVARALQRCADALSNCIAEFCTGKSCGCKACGEWVDALDVAASKLGAALRALDASPDAGAFCPTCRKSRDHEPSYCSNSFHLSDADVIKQLRAELAEAEKHAQRMHVSAERDASDNIALRSELATIAERTAKAQRECVAKTMHDRGWDNAVNATLNTPLVTNAAEPDAGAQEKTSSAPCEYEEGGDEAYFAAKIARIETSDIPMSAAAVRAGEAEEPAGVSAGSVAPAAKETGQLCRWCEQPIERHHGSGDNPRYCYSRGALTFQVAPCRRAFCYEPSEESEAQADEFDRFITIIDEAFGMQPVQPTMDAALLTLERLLLKRHKRDSRVYSERDRLRAKCSRQRRELRRLNQQRTDTALRRQVEAIRFAILGDEPVPAGESLSMVVRGLVADASLMYGELAELRAANLEAANLLAETSRKLGEAEGELAAMRKREAPNTVWERLMERLRDCANWDQVYRLQREPYQPPEPARESRAAGNSCAKCGKPCGDWFGCADCYPPNAAARESRCIGCYLQSGGNKVYVATCPEHGVRRETCVGCNGSRFVNVGPGTREACRRCLNTDGCVCGKLASGEATFCEVHHCGVASADVPR